MVSSTQLFVATTAFLTAISSAVPLTGPQEHHSHKTTEVHILKHGFSKTGTSVRRGPIEINRSSAVQVRNSDFASNGPAAYLKALKRYNFEVPLDLHMAVKRSVQESSRVANDPQDSDSQYLSPVQIGTPAQTLQLDFDTGSSDLWVFSTTTAASEVRGQTLFDSSKSFTAKNMNDSVFSLNYGDLSSASGTVITDSVSIGGLNTNMAVELATYVSQSFTDITASDGIVGLAFQRLNGVKPTKAKTFVQSANVSVFTADLKKGTPGSWEFGNINSSKYTGDIAYTPVDDASGYWAFTATGYAVGTADYVETEITSVADSGTSLILLPPTEVTAYYSHINGSAYSSTYGAMVYPCSSEVPSFVFGVGTTYKAVVPAEYMTYTQINSTHCYGGVQTNGGATYAVFGDIALKSQFIIFDVTNTQIGFASKILA